MKQKANKITQKIAIIIACIISINFIAPTYISNADTGGVLFRPIKAFVTTIFDTVMYFVDWSISGNYHNIEDENAIEAENESSRFSGNIKKLSMFWFKVTPEKIFSNQIELLNIDFINPINQNNYSVSNETTTSALTSLRTAIANWYVAIRNLALVAMLSMLVYVGIKIIISSAASDKAKYKQMLIDWVVGIFLLFMLHYIMAFTLLITEKITDMIDSANSSAAEVMDEDKDKLKVKDGKYYIFGGTLYGNNGEKQGETYINKMPDLMHYARFYVQLGDFFPSLTFLIVYIVLVIYTLWFLVIYLKRVLYIAFLTMIAPFVAMTYPLDKMNDGKAQAFNMWLKEYLMNALIQPFHLMLYTVLIGTSVELAKSHMIYALVALGFLLSSEKLLKKMFGLDKASTPPGLGGALAAGAGSQLAKNLLSKGKGSSNVKPGSGGNGSADSSSSTQTRSLAKYDFGDFKPTNSANLENKEWPGNQADNNMNEQTENREVADENNNRNDLANNQNKENEGITSDDSYRDSLTNNQNQELDAYMNSEAYGNGRTDQNNNKNEKPKGTARKMAALASRKAGSAVKRTITNPKTYQKLAKGIGKGVAKTGGALAMGTIGLAAGVATGDLSKTMSLAGAGAIAGSKMGEKAFDTVADSTSGMTERFMDFKNEAQNGYDKAQEQKRERAAKRQENEFKQNSTNQKYFENKTGKHGSDLKETMNQAAYYDRFEGFEDNATKLKAVELENYFVGKGYDQEDARNMILSGKKMASVRKEGDLEKQDTYAQEINNRGGQQLDNKTKQALGNDLMTAAKYMKGMTNKPKNTTRRTNRK